MSRVTRAACVGSAEGGCSRPQPTESRWLRRMVHVRVVCGNAFQRYRTKAVCSDVCAAIVSASYQATSDARRQGSVSKRDFTPSRMAGCILSRVRGTFQAHRDRLEARPDKSRAWQQKRRER